MDQITAPPTMDAHALHGSRKSESFNLAQAIRSAVRTSPWLTIAVCVHLLAGAIFAVVHFAGEAKESDEGTVIQAQIATRAPEQEAVEEAPPEIFDRKAIPENIEAELVANEVAEITTVDSLVDPNDDFSKERGNPDAIENLPEGSTGGSSIGVSGVGHRGSGVPSAFLTRKLGRGGGPKGVNRGGPTEGTEKAIRDGLVWLARHQEKDGHWSAKTFSQRCPPGKPCQPETAVEMGGYPDKQDVGLTGLSLLAYLGAGFGHDSKLYLIDVINKQKLAIGKDIVKKGLQWLVDRQDADGAFYNRDGSYFLYNEALAALALSEAYGLTQNTYWKEPAQRAINFICKAQKPNPKDPNKLWGWRYQPIDVLRADPDATPMDFSDADMSVTGWMVMALKSAQISGLQVPEASIEGALDFTKWSTGRKGQVGYIGPESAGIKVTGDHDNYEYHFGTMSSIAMCVRIFLEHDLKDPFLVEGADLLLADLPAIGKDEQHPQLDYYYWYYGSLALNQIDGPDAPRRTDKYWGPWNKSMQNTILELQDQREGTCTNGGWMKPDRWAYGVGPIYTTAINILTLEVYYRYANAFGTKDIGKPPARSSSAEKTSPAAPASTEPPSQPPAEPAPAPAPEGNGNEPK
jgi:hypothetical protein